MSARHSKRPERRNSPNGDPEPAGDPRATGIRSTGAPAGPQPSGERETVEWIGRVIDDRYRIVEQLGEGGMGTVFVAEHLKLQKRVALKTILPQFAGDGEMAARFAREAMASARLDHPHVASALDYGALPEGGAYLVMQLVRGRGLNDVIEQDRLPWPQACAIAAQVADALAAAHAEGIVHRDLKPENVLLERRDDGSDLVKVLDFGIARVSAEEGGAPEGAAPTRALTRLGTVMGTPGYMAPEQAMGERVDHRVDLYALGVVLWEMLAGKPLFEGADLTQIVTRQLTEEPPSVRDSCGDTTIPDPLEELLGQLLARNAKERPERASEVRDSLRQLAFGNPTTGTFTLPTIGVPQQPPAGPGQASTSNIGAPGVRPRPTGHVPRAVVVRGRKIPIPAIVAACALPLMIGSLALTWGLESDGDSSAAPASTPLGQLAKQAKKIALPKPIPPAVQEHIGTLLEHDSRTARRKAARWLQKHEPADEVPDYARAIADLELARGCSDLEAALGAVREEGDERALPAVDRLHRRPRRGCGFMRMRDCLSCVRADIAATRTALGADDADEVPAPEG